MTRKIKLLDLCCGAGGCSVGYKRAADELGMDIEITGVDLYDQPNYPYYFERDDALAFLTRECGYFTHVHASPPCQEYSNGSAPTRAAGKRYESNLLNIRVKMYELSVPGVIENVPGSPLIRDIELTGAMFGLKILRRRVFETVHWFCLKPSLPQYKRGAQLNGDIISVFGNGTMMAKRGGEIKVPGSTVLKKRMNGMGIDWMTNREIAQAIPPAYTKYIGMEFLKR